MSLVRRIALCAAMALLVVAVVATPSTLAQETAVASSEQIAQGIAAYEANYCGVCHALAIAGTRGTFGPTHDGMAATAADRLSDPAYSGASDTPEAYIRESIVDPMAYVVPGFAMTPHAMPSFAHVTTGDLDALVALLMAQ